MHKYMHICKRAFYRVYFPTSAPTRLNAPSFSLPSAVSRSFMTFVVDGAAIVRIPEFRFLNLP